MIDTSITGPAARLLWLDVARGIAILLVVIGHAGRGMTAAGLPDPAGLMAAMDSVLYAFHMPLLFLLAGLLHGARQAPDNWPRYAGRRILRLMWPMVIWTYVFIALRAAMGAHANTPVQTGDLLILPLPPYDHMWFLWALLLGCLTLAAIDRAASLSSARTAILGAVAGLAWLIGLWDLPEPAAALIGPAVAHFPFLCLGAALGAGGALRLRMTGVRAALAACAFVAALILVLQHDAPASPAWGSLIALVLSLAGCAILRHVTVNAPMNPLIGTFAFLGQGSLAIYVAHTIFSAPTREALLALGVDGLAAQLVLGTLAGLLGPIALLLAARTTGISRVAGLA